MVSFQKLCVLSLTAVTTLAAPPLPPNSKDTAAGAQGCLDDGAAAQVGTLWTQLIGSFTKELADSSLTPNYTDYSESALSLNAICPQAPGPAPPLMAPVFTNRTIFEMGQGMQKPIASTILNIWHGCSDVTMRYEMTNIGSATRPVVGIINIQTTPAPAGNQYPNLISATYSEFDSSAWVSNLQDAGTCTQSNATAARS